MTQKHFIRASLTAVPLGLVALTIAAFVFFFSKDTAELKSTHAISSMFRREISEQDLRDSVAMLATTIGPRPAGEERSLRMAATWIESSLGPSNMGYKVEKQVYEADGQEFRNLIAELPGGERALEIVVVGAHYDSVPDSPAANDNGTGVAALLAIANAFVGTKHARTLRFVAFVNEEPPFFQTESMGSLVYARHCRERGDNIVAMISLETLGYYTDAPDSQRFPPNLRERYPSTGNFLALVGNTESAGLVDQTARAFRSHSDFPLQTAALPASLPGVGFSDHWSFWEVGYPALMATDTAMFRYPDYHLPSDTPDKIAFPAFTSAVKGLAAAIGDLANSPTVPSPPDTVPANAPEAGKTPP